MNHLGSRLDSQELMFGPLFYILKVAKWNVYVSDVFVEHTLQMLNWTDIWAIGSQVNTSKSLLCSSNHSRAMFCLLAERIILLEEVTLWNEHGFHERMYMFNNSQVGDRSRLHLHE